VTADSNSIGSAAGPAVIPLAQLQDQPSRDPVKKLNVINIMLLLGGLGWPSFLVNDKLMCSAEMCVVFESKYSNKNY